MLTKSSSSRGKHEQYSREGRFESAFLNQRFKTLILPSQNKHERSLGHIHSTPGESPSAFSSDQLISRADRSARSINHSVILEVCWLNDKCVLKTAAPHYRCCLRYPTKMVTTIIWKQTCWIIVNGLKSILVLLVLLPATFNLQSVCFHEWLSLHFPNTLFFSFQLISMKEEKENHVCNDFWRIFCSDNICNWYAYTCIRSLYILNTLFYCHDCQKLTTMFLHSWEPDNCLFYVWKKERNETKLNFA